MTITFIFDDIDDFQEYEFLNFFKTSIFIENTIFNPIIFIKFINFIKIPEN